MTQSTFRPEARLVAGRLHVAIIMDGNGRWAERRGLPRSAGHRAGASAVRRTVRAAATQAIGTLTLYAFSADNWRRPAAEVRHLMRLFRTHLRSEAERCRSEGIRVSVIGRRDRLAPDLLAAIESIETRTREGRRLHLQLAVDYSSRDAILEAARLLRSVAPGQPAVSGSPAGASNPPPGRASTSPRARASTPPPAFSREAFAELISEALHAGAPVPEVDLLIRTGGEQRLSDFMLWECAYAELVFASCLWPDFAEADLARAMAEFQSRQRRFGGLAPPCVPEPPEPSEAVHPLSSPSCGMRERQARARG